MFSTLFIKNEHIKAGRVLCLKENEHMCANIEEQGRGVRRVCGRANAVMQIVLCPVSGQVGVSVPASIDEEGRGAACGHPHVLPAF